MQQTICDKVGPCLPSPQGTIEPDPSVRVVDPLAGWSDSSELLVRLVPETIVLPIAVSGVISRTAHQHRIAKRFADPKEREWAAATLQVLCRHLRDTQTRVVIGEPISSGQFSQRAAIHAAMASLLARVSNPHDENLTTSNQTYHELATNIRSAVGTLAPVRVCRVPGHSRLCPYACAGPA